MNELPKFIEDLFDEKGISVIDTDKKGRLQTSLVYTVNLIFEYINLLELGSDISKRGLIYLIEAIGQENPSLELKNESKIFEKLEQIYKYCGMSDIKVQEGYSSMHDFLVFSKARSKDAIAVSLWNTYNDKTDEGEIVTKCEERTEFEEIEYRNGESPIGTDLYGNILKENTFCSVISAVYSNMSKEEKPMSRKVATALLDQIPKEGENEKGYRPSQRILDFYRPGVTVNSFDKRNPDRILLTYLGTEIAILDTFWNSKKDGTIHSNSGSSLVLTNLDTVDKLRKGQEKITNISGRKYHINEAKLRKLIGTHLSYTSRGYMWYLMQRRAEEYVKMMNSLLETSDERIYEFDYRMTPENKKDEQIEKWIGQQKSFSRSQNSNISARRRRVIQKIFGDYSYEKVKFAWACKSIRQYMEEYDGKYPTASTNPKLAKFVNNSSRIVNTITKKLMDKEQLTESELFKFQQLMKIGIIDKIYERMFNIEELYKAKEEYQKQLEISKSRKNMNKGEN